MPVYCEVCGAGPLKAVYDVPVHNHIAGCALTGSRGFIGSNGIAGA